MSTIILHPHETMAGTHEAAPARGPGLLKRIWLALIRGRQASADRQIRQILAHYTEAQLLSFGFSEAEVAAIRGGTPLTKAVCWNSLR